MTDVREPSRSAVAYGALGWAIGAASVSVIVALGFGAAEDVSGGVVAIAAVLGMLPGVAAAAAVAVRVPPALTPADHVTLLRAALAAGCAAITAIALWSDASAQSWALVAIAVPTLALDAVDGWVARRTGTSHPAGATLDAELDAGVVVVLSLAAATELGWWVLALGAMRYLLLVASWARPSLRADLPRSQFRRTVAGLQGAALVIALAPVTSRPVGIAITGVALGLLLASFGSEVVLKERQAAVNRHPGGG